LIYLVLVVVSYFAIIAVVFCPKKKKKTSLESKQQYPAANIEYLSVPRLIGWLVYQNCFWLDDDDAAPAGTRRI
jgi:hypothetical protein